VARLRSSLARHGADTFGYKANLRIDRKLAQLLRLRVSQINNCTYGLNLIAEELDSRRDWFEPVNSKLRHVRRPLRMQLR